MTAFTAGALVISATVAGASYAITVNALLNGREKTAVRAAYYDAGIVNAGLQTVDPDVIEVLRSLDTGGGRHAVLYRQGQPYAKTADSGYTQALPDGLRRDVAAGQPAVQRVTTESGPALAVGVPLPDGNQFYVVDSLAELDRTVRVLSLVLTLVAAATTAAGALLGAWATRRVVRPLRLVTDAATHIAAGDLSARLDPATEPDLGRLTGSFNRMVDQLAARIDRDRRFAADVSHELRSPLQTLSAAASVLARRRDGLDPRTAQAADLICDEVDRFSLLVTDLIELARADQPADRQPVDVADLARTVCRDRTLDPGLVLTGPGETRWLVDRRRLTQAIANLVDNAVRHGGGLLSIRVFSTPSTWTLHVDDDGPGVAAADRDAIFDRFMRGRGAHARGDTDGTGLGLAIVAGHVAAHDGQITVTDRPGGGARFEITLPAQHSDEAP